jgi:hypothetical protein
MSEFYENGIQGMAYETSDARVACDLDDPQVRTLGFRVDMPEGMVECDMNVDRLGCWPPEEGQREFDNAVEAARLFVAAPDLLAVVERLQAWGKTSGPDQMANLADIIHDANAALAKAGGAR